jgi:DNA-directed RNA polymerase omega subunit
MIEKVGCKYALVCLVTKRARQLLDKDSEGLNNSGERAIAIAAREVYGGRVTAGYED